MFFEGRHLLEKFSTCFFVSKYIEQMVEYSGFFQHKFLLLVNQTTIH